MDTRRGPDDWLTFLEQFRDADQNGKLSTFRKRRWDHFYEHRSLLAEDALASMSMEQAVALYRASGSSKVKDFRTNPVEEVRDSLDFLLYDTIRLEGRFDESAHEEGAYRLAGAGKEFVSYLLCLREPSLLGVWNSNAEGMLQVLHMYPTTLRKGRLGTRYIELLDALQRVRGRLGLVDYREVDEFAYAVNRMVHSNKARVTA